MIEPYLESFEAFSANGGAAAPDWARALRLSAITRFETLGFPTTHNEDWHFTSVGRIVEANLRRARMRAAMSRRPTWRHSHSERRAGTRSSL